MRRLAPFIFALVLLVSCNSSSQLQTKPQPIAVHTATATSPPTSSPSPSPTSTPLPSSTPLPTIDLTATVWTEDPITVVLTYHQFAANHAEKSTGLKVRFEDFEYQLNQIYEAGFVLVPLEDWMAGKIVVPEGRRPLIFSMDDLYMNNQIRLDENGEPRENTGIGILWNFYQEHPDFGFSAAFFVSLGNKLYADPDFPTWEQELADTIAWGIDHNLIPYNHFYSHPRLLLTEDWGILWELNKNDEYLRELLLMAEREDQFARLHNYIALTYGIWPTRGGTAAMLTYETPEGLPVEGVFEIDPISLEKYLPAPWSPAYDLLRMPRHVASPSAVDFLVENAYKFPQAQTCVLEILAAEVNNTEKLPDLIGEAAEKAGCPSGVYIVEETAYRVDIDSGDVGLLEIQTELEYGY